MKVRDDFENSVNKIMKYLELTVSNFHCMDRDEVREKVVSELKTMETEDAENIDWIMLTAKIGRKL